uniref:EF-hand domain-containing protein n=1 Tax=Lutzomyia longipalpis TaxID=7200 RepID=A0A1B0CW79_LUTLO
MIKNAIAENYDVNQSGEIDIKDFEQAIEKICTLRGWPAGSAKNQETYEEMLKIWEGLRSKADKDNDGQVSVDEWCIMWDAYAKDPSTVMDWQQRYMNFMFDLEDASNDGTIDAREFATVCSCYGTDRKECEEAFAKMSKVSVDEWCIMWDAYAKDPSTVMDWQQRYMNFMFDLEDASNDGTIDAREFATVCSCYGTDRKECEEAFAKMSKGQEEVSREEFAELWQEYFASEDPSAPGNYIFGNLSF